MHGTTDIVRATEQLVTVAGESELAASGGGLTLAVEENSCDREAEIVLMCEHSSVELVSVRRHRNHTSSSVLFEQQIHESVDPYVWPRHLVPYYFLSCFAFS